VSVGASRLLGFAGLRFLAAERVGLAMLFAAGFVQALAEFTVLFFHLGQAAFQAVVVWPEGLDFLGQQGDASAEVQQFPIAFLAAETRGRTRGHNDLHELCAARGRLVLEVLQPRCILIVRTGSRGRDELEPATCQEGKQSQLQFTVNMYD
jgi:hypothetical protein